MSDSPAALLVDVSGSLMAVTSSLRIPFAQTGILVAGVGSDGIVRYPNIDSNSALKITGSISTTAGGTQTVTGSLAVDNVVRITSTGSLLVTGSVLSLPFGTQTIAGTVTSNVTGTVNIDRGNTIALPLFVSGTVAITVTSSLPVTVTSIPQVTITSTGSLPVVFSGVASVTGSVGITNQVFITTTGSLPVSFPGGVTSNVTGTVNLDRGNTTALPLFVSGAVTMTVTSSLPVTVTSIPQVTITSTGSIPVSFPGGVTSNVTGTVNLDRGNTTVLPLFISGSVGIGGPVNVVGTVNTVPSGVQTVTVTSSLPVTVTSIPQVAITTTGSLPVVFSGVASITGSVGITNQVFITSTGSLPVSFPGGVNANVTGTVNLDRGNNSTFPLFITGSLATTPSVGPQIVVGNDASGSTITVNPIPIAGISSTNTIKIPRVEPILGQTVNQVSVAATITSPGAQGVGTFAYVNAYGALRVSPESSCVFNETFDSSTIDTVKWTTVTSGGGTVTFGGGSGSINAGTTANAYAYIKSNPTFISYGTTFEIYGAVSTFFGVSTGNYSFLGVGTPQSVPTGANPLFDAVGFEYDLTGSLRACVYNSGSALYKSAPLSPAPGTLPGRYGFHMRPDLVLWYYPGSEYPCASVNFSGSFIYAQPVLNLSVNGTSSLGSATGIRVQNQNINDSGRNNVSISDGTYFWRKSTVDASGSLSITPSSTPGSVVSSVAGSATSVTLLAANAQRRWSSFYNDSVSSAYLKLGTAALTSSFTVKMISQAYYEAPPYNGIVTALWTTATGSMRITELS